MPHEEAREYIATQMVSEYLANRVKPASMGSSSVQPRPEGADT